MLCLETIEPDTLELLNALQRDPVFAGSRLVGGTALALQLGHRKSVDLDFFGQLPVSGIELEQALSVFGSVALANRSRLVETYFVRDIKVDFVDYPYPWLDMAVEIGGLRLASPRDIAAMKLSAITSRGSRKDFVDLAFLLERYPLSEMLTFYGQKYENASQFLVLKSLTFFEDAEETPMPLMLKPRNWTWVKQQVSNAVSDLR